jgi:hypothetical protein
MSLALPRATLQGPCAPTPKDLEGFATSPRVKPGKVTMHWLAVALKVLAPSPYLSKTKINCALKNATKKCVSLIFAESSLSFFAPLRGSGTKVVGFHRQ